MGWDPVAWAVGGGAQVSAETARVLAYAATRGSEGVFGIGDLKVTATATPGSTVDISPGVAAALCRASAQTYQTYIGRMPVADNIAISSTGAGSGRSDLIVARVEDPWLAGEPWSDPSDATVGPYIFTRVISGVPNTTKTVTALSLGYSAIPLARIDIPASTGTITNAMITDLRVHANPRRDRSLLTVNPGSTISTSATSTYADWLGAWTVDVPTWAAKAVLVATVSGAALDKLNGTTNGNAVGTIRIALGGTTVVTQGAAYDLDVPPSFVRERFTLACGDTVTIPSGMRGTNVTARIQAAKTSGNKTMYADTGTFATLDCEFREAVG